MKFSNYIGIRELKDLIPKKYDQDFIDIRQWWDEHNSGARTWDTVNATNAVIGGQTGPYLPMAGGTLTGNLAFNPTTKGVTGTTTNDNTSSGNVGEYVVATVSRASAQTINTSGAYQDLQSISLTAGDWDVTTETGILPSTTSTGWETGISQTAGNSATGMNYGDNLLQNSLTGLGAVFDDSATIAAYRQSLASTTTIYHKITAFFGVTKPSVYGRISARRVR